MKGRRPTDRSRVSGLDIVSDVLSGVRSRFRRAVLTSLGTTVGVGCVVASVGLAITASRQVSDRFDILRATQVTLEDTRPDDHRAPFPADVRTRIGRVPGVRHAGVTWVVDDSASAVRLPATVSGATVEQLPLIAADSDALLAMRPDGVHGRLFDQGHDRAAARVAVVGRGAADRLGVAPGSRSTLLIDGVPFVVVGVIDGIDRRSEALVGVTVPAAAAVELWGEPVDAQLLVDASPGAAGVIADQAPVAIWPEDPTRLAAEAPPDPRLLRERVSEDLTALAFGLGAISLILGIVSTASTSVVSILERVPEIGLRRAVGARTRHIAGLVLVETGLVGFAGGVLGAWTGLMIVSGVSLANGWSAVLDPLLLVLGPAVGLAAGALAGLYPAILAARIAPSEALRR